MRQTIVFIMLAFAFVVACAKEVPVEKVDIRSDGLVYEAHSDMPFNGTTVSYWSNGNLKERSTFKNGKLNGPYELRTQDGKVLMKFNYSKEDVGKILREFIND